MNESYNNEIYMAKFKPRSVTKFWKQQQKHSDKKYSPAEHLFNYQRDNLSQDNNKKALN